MPKTKKGYKKPSNANTKFKKKIKMFRPGYDRTGGAYGRYSASGEMKYHDVLVQETDVPAAGVTMGALLTIAQNTLPTGRIGRQITIKEIHIRSRASHSGVTGASLASTEPRTLRVILVQDKQANGASGGIASVLKTADYLSYRNLDNSKRFNILMDKTVSLNPPLAWGAGPTYTTNGIKKQINFNKKCNMIIDYDQTATTGALSTIRSNNIFLLAITDTNLECDYEAQVRIRYTDK